MLVSVLSLRSISGCADTQLLIAEIMTIGLLMNSRSASGFRFPKKFSSFFLSAQSFWSPSSISFLHNQKTTTRGWVLRYTQYTQGPSLPPLIHTPRTARTGLGSLTQQSNRPAAARRVVVLVLLRGVEPLPLAGQRSR